MIIGDNCVTKQHEGWTKPSESMPLFCVLKVLLKGTPHFKMMKCTYLAPNLVPCVFLLLRLKGLKYEAKVHYTQARLPLIFCMLYSSGSTIFYIHTVTPHFRLSPQYPQHSQTAWKINS